MLCVISLYIGYCIWQFIFHIIFSCNVLKLLDCRVFYTNMDFFERVSESLPDIILEDSSSSNENTVGVKRKFFGNEIKRKCQRTLPNNELPQQSLMWPHDNLHILSGGSGTSLQNSASTSSDVLTASVENLQQFELEHRKQPPDDGMLCDIDPQQSSESVCLAKPLDDTSTSNPSNNLISMRDFDRPFHVISDAGHLSDELNQMKVIQKQDQPSSVIDSNIGFKEKSNFKPKYVFSNLLDGCSDDDFKDVEEMRIFHLNLPMDVLTKEQFLLKEIRNGFAHAKLQNSTSQTETTNINQTLDDGECQILADMNSQDLFDYDIFLDSIESIQTKLDAALEAQYNELKSTKDSEVFSPAPSTSNDSEGKKNECNSPPSSPLKPSSEQRSFISSYAEEMQMIVYPVISDAFPILHWELNEIKKRYTERLQNN